LKFAPSASPGHFWADNELLDNYGPRIGPHGIAVYMALARFANNETGNCWVSHDRICEITALGITTVKATLQLLKEAGLIGIECRQKSGRPNLYTILAIDKEGSRHTARGSRDTTTGQPPHGDPGSRHATTNNTNNNKTEEQDYILQPQQADLIPNADAERGAVEEVFNYYLQRMNKNLALYGLTEMRIEVGRKAFRICRDKTETAADAIALMKAVVDGVAENKWLMGENDRKKTYNSWEKHLFRSQEQIEARLAAE
jgi:hypothetical protein